jgi:zinc protease
MKRSFVYAILLAGFAACAPAAQQGSSGYPTTAPVPGAAREFATPVSVERTLPNGMRVIYVSKPQLPIVQATLITRGGQSDDPAQIQGLGSFTASLLDEGAGGRSALEFAAAVEQLGASLQAGVTWDAAQVNLHVLSEEFPEALQLMADMVIRPDFPANEVERVRQERLTNLARGRDEPARIASNAFSALVYGPEHPYGRLTTEESARRADRQTVVDYHRRFYTPAASTLLLVGDVNPSMQPMIERVFGGWTGANPAPTPVAAPRQLDRTRIYLVDKPGAAQSQMLIGHSGAARNTPDYYALEVMNTLLGGSFTSRLSQNLREAHGYTYGASSGFGFRRGAGPFTAGAAVVTAKTDSAVIEFFREIERIRDEPVSAEELEQTKRYLTLGLPQQLETTGQIASSIAELAIYELPLDYYDDYVRQIMAVTAQDVQRVARQYLQPERAAVVVVGDRATIESGLRALPFGEVEVRPVEEFVR